MEQTKNKANVLDFDIWWMVLNILLERPYHRKEGKSRQSPRNGVSFHKLRSLRLVSRQLNEIITPLVYRSMDLSRGFLTSGKGKRSEYPCKVFMDNIITYTQHLKVTSQRDVGFCKITIDLVGKCKKLDVLSWDVENIAYDQRLASQYLNAFLQNSRDCWFQLHRQRISICQIGNHTSTRVYTPPRTSSKPLLRHLQLEGKSCNGWFVLTETGTALPPMEKLSLFEYDWRHSAATYTKLWDFSRLRNIHFRSCFSKFMDCWTGVPYRDLKNLETVRITGGGYLMSPNRPYNKTLLCFINGLPSLRELEMEHDKWECEIDLEFLERLRAPAVKLFKLKGHISHKPMSIPILSRLKLSFPNMEELGLDLAANGPNSLELLEMLPSFQNLRRLAIFADALEVEEAKSGLSESDKAEMLTDRLNNRKPGVPFDVITIKIKKCKNMLCTYKSVPGIDYT